MIPLGSAAFLLFGVVLVVLGACQPGIVASLGLDETGWGLLGGALSLGIGAGVLVAGPLVDRLPRRPIFLASTLLTGAALASVDEGMSTLRVTLHIAAMGVGAGIYDTLLNTVTIERWREDPVRPLGLLHAMVTIGAIATPLLVAAFGGAGEWVLIFRSAGAAYLVLSVWVALVALPAPASSTPSAGATLRVLATRPAFAALCVIGFAYVGIEASLTLFAIPYAQDGLGLDEFRGSRAISAFWLGILLGRLLLLLPVGPFRRVDAWAIALAGLAAACVVGLGALLGIAQVELVLGAAGLALAGVFPLMIALAGEEVPEARGLATGLVAGLGSAGGFALPASTGVLADAHGISAAIAALAVWCGFISLAALFARRAHRTGS